MTDSPLTARLFEAVRQYIRNGIDAPGVVDELHAAFYEARDATRAKASGEGLPVRVLADDAIGLFIEYRDKHGHDELDARLAAVNEVVEGAALAADSPVDGGLDVERLARADWEVFGGARASGSTWDDLDDRTKAATLDYTRQVAAEYASLQPASPEAAAGEEPDIVTRIENVAARIPGPEMEEYGSVDWRSWALAVRQAYLAATPTPTTEEPTHPKSDG